jgi:hypothetical protein
VTVRLAISGIVAGSLAAFGFAVVYGYLISQIWFSLPMLLFAEALCGSCLSATYRLICDTPSLRGF